MNEIIVTPHAELRLLHDNIEINGCLEWVGYIDEKGYGKISINGKMYRVHRVAWVWYHNIQPKGLICHHCDNPSCYKKGHLYDGTSSTNAKDAFNRNSKLKNTKKYERQIYEEHLKYYTTRELAVKFKTSQSSISRAIFRMRETK